MDIRTLKEFEVDTRSVVPGFEVKWKDESFSQKLLGWVLFFNPRYMTGYITTLYPFVYFPSKEDYEANPMSSLKVLAHERVHLMDSVRHGLWFKVSYLLPQVLLIPLFVASLTCYLAHLKLVALILLVLGVASLLPWPSPWRVNWEQRGYAMTFAVNYWVFGSVSDSLRQSVRENFLGWSYFKMSRSPSSIDDWIQKVIASIEDGTICNDESYASVRRFLLSRGLAR